MVISCCEVLRYVHAPSMDQEPSTDSMSKIVFYDVSQYFRSVTYLVFFFFMNVMIVAFQVVGF